MLQPCRVNNPATFAGTPGFFSSLSYAHNNPVSSVR